MSEQQKAYWTNEVAKMLNTSNASINRWTRVLELELGYEIILGTEGRAYTQKDIDLFKKIQEIMKNGPRTKTSDAARKALGLAPTERYVDGERARVSQNQVQSSDSERAGNQATERERSSELAVARAIEHERDQMMVFYENVIEDLQHKVQDLEERLENQDIQHRVERVDVWSIRTDVRKMLKKDAETEWLNLPDSERKHKVFRGLFPKTVENEDKKRWFINEYVMDRIDEEVARRLLEKQEETSSRRNLKFIDTNETYET